MSKYHLTEDGPKPCTARVRQCPLGEEVSHFPTKAEAQVEYEKELAESHGNVATTSRAGFSKSLELSTPVDIDSKLAELYYQAASTRAKIAAAGEQEQHARKYLQKHVDQGGSKDHPNYRSYEKTIERATTAQLELSEQLHAVEKETEPYDAEFERRGGWNRAFLVSNGNGHVHKDMNCSTCFPSTEYSWMTDYSDKSEEEIVEAAGERACTVCYPSAPVSTLSKPTKMFTEDEKKRDEARQERERKRAEKEAKAAAAGITGEDGGALRVPSWGDKFETVKTERAAQTMAVDALIDQKRTAKALEKNEGYFNPEVGVQAGKKLDVLVPALARKRGQSEDEVNSELSKKAASKWKREWSAVYGPWSD